MPKKKKKNLYREYLEEAKKEREIQELKDKYDIKDTNILVENKKGNFINIIISIFGSIGKFILYIVLFILLTAGATILINSNLRNEMLSIFINNI